jgi:hypothetical protein
MERKHELLHKWHPKLKDINYRPDESHLEEHYRQLGHSYKEAQYLR